jgi:hypothetical protein
MDFLDLFAGRWHSGKHAPIPKLKSQLLQIPYAVHAIFLFFNKPAGCYRIYNFQTHLLAPDGFWRSQTHPLRSLPSVFPHPIPELIIIATSSQEISMEVLNLINSLKIVFTNVVLIRHAGDP